MSDDPNDPRPTAAPERFDGGGEMGAILCLLLLGVFIAGFALGWLLRSAL